MNNQCEQFGKWSHIPAPLLFSRDISVRGKLLYALLDCMSNSRGYAFAKNETLLRYLALHDKSPSERTLQRTLKELVDAGYIVIENGSGGRNTLRRIYTREVYPINPDMGVGVNPDIGDGVINRNNIEIKNKKKEKAATQQCGEKDILDWFDVWVAKLEADPEESKKLCQDLHAFFEMRKAKRKPILTINAAGRHAAKLLAYAADFPENRIAVMRYVLGESIEHNWEKLYPISDNNREDFWRWMKANYSQKAPKETEEEYF